MHKRRIFLCITLAQQGGAQSFVLKLAKYLQGHGHEISVIAGEGGWLKDRCQEQNIGFLAISSLKREISPVDDWKATQELTRLFQQEKPDVVQLNSTKMGIIGAYAARKARVPRVVYRIGGWVFLEQLPLWKKWMYEHLEKISARWKDVIICVHPGDKDVALNAGIKPRERIVAIPNGIDTDRFERELRDRSAARNRFNLNDEDIVFGSIANFFPPKNLPQYMEACALVAEQLPKAKFLIIGDGLERSLIEKQRDAYQLQDRVLLPGAIENAPSLLRAFDVYVLPSSKEGMATSLLEAMAAGLPIVATDVGAAAWMLDNGRCGWLSPYHDMKALAENMLRAYASLPENERGLAAKEKALHDFPIARTLQRTEEIIIPS